jgi:hypothetical protein
MEEHEVFVLAGRDSALLDNFVSDVSRQRSGLIFKGYNVPDDGGLSTHIHASICSPEFLLDTSPLEDETTVLSGNFRNKIPSGSRYRIHSASKNTELEGRVCQSPKLQNSVMCREITLTDLCNFPVRYRLSSENDKQHAVKIHKKLLLTGK